MTNDKWLMTPYTGTIRFTRIFHESLAATTDMAVLPGVLGWSAPATYRSGTPRNRHPAVARWHAHLRCLATAIHEISGFTVSNHELVGR